MLIFESNIYHSERWTISKNNQRIYYSGCGLQTQHIREVRERNCTTLHRYFRRVIKTGHRILTNRSQLSISRTISLQAGFYTSSPQSPPARTAHKDCIGNNIVPCILRTRIHLYTTVAVCTVAIQRMTFNLCCIYYIFIIQIRGFHFIRTRFDQIL